MSIIEKHEYHKLDFLNAIGDFQDGQNLFSFLQCGRIPLGGYLSSASISKNGGLQLCCVDVQYRYPCFVAVYVHRLVKNEILFGANRCNSSEDKRE